MVAISIDLKIQQLKQTRDRALIDNVKGKMLHFPSLLTTNQQPNPE